MTYFEAVQLVKNIESKYDVMSIRYKGVSVWPYLRLYLLDGISVRTEVKASRSIIKIVLKSLFVYSPFILLKKHDIWLFTGCERRKRIGEKMIHRISGGISSSVYNCLMIEKPDLLLGHYPKKEIEEHDIVSESWLLILFHLIELVLRVSNLRIENEDLMKKILVENNLSFDYLRYVRMLNAKRLSLIWLLSIVNKPRLILMECPYDSMGYMWACHQKGIKFLELQHGVAGKSHNAYNARFYEPQMQPDGLCVFGSEEYRYFTEEEPQYSPNVYMTGLYMLERVNEYFVSDVFKPYRDKYAKVVVVSGQNGYEQPLSVFVNDVANHHGNLLFVYVPRMADVELQFSSSNVEVVRNCNIYEYLKWADLHITISSTTCLEAQYFHTPTIFYDYDNRASTYYGQLLKETNGSFYVMNVDEFERALDGIQNLHFKYKEVFVHNHVKRIIDVINKHICGTNIEEFCRTNNDNIEKK